MATRVKPKKRARTLLLFEEQLPAFGDELQLFRRLAATKRGKRKMKAKASERAQALLNKVGSELQKPGISSQVVFKNRKSGVFAYSIDPKNPQRIIRKSSAGKTSVGRLTDGRFKAF